jgi:hypothetical protein
MKSKIKIGVICGIICFFLGAFLTKIYWPNVEYKITDSSVGQTQHHVDTSTVDINNPEDCQKIADCANSDLNVEGHIEGNRLVGKAYDACKYVDFMFEFAAQNTKNHIFQFGLGYSIQNGYYLRPGYLYDLNFIAVGGSIIFPISEYKNFAFEVMVQKAFDF